LPSIKHFICVGETIKNDIDYEQLISSTPYKNLPEQVQSEDLAWLFYTSGTTGKPKGAMLSHRNLIAMANSYLSDVNPVKQKDVLLHAAPITHGSGLIIFHHIVRAASHTFPSNSSFIPNEIFKNIQDNKVTTMFLAPTMINMLVSSKEISKYDVSSLHTVIYGGGPMYTEHILKAIDIFGNIFTQIYGQGEAPMAITTLPKNEHITNNDPLLLKRLSSAGTEITGIHVKIIDSNDNELPLGKHGEIVVRGDLVMNGYFNNKEATSQTLRNGWLHTGDIGYLDTNRYLYITDRKNDMIISGGSNIYPREIEEVIATHPSVAEVAVIGIPDDTWGESVKAFVVSHEKKQLSEKEIIEFCLIHLASYKKPKSVEILSSLPQNAYGKIEKQTLRQPYWKNLERNV
jgi:long-chain acyl-CoA synthetase